ncbi:MAG: fimbrillin family protein, partial [Bacteroides sp.]
MSQRLYLFIGMLLGILITTSCNKEEEEATDGWQPGNQAIAFAVDADESFLPHAPHASRTTRGATSTTSSMTDFRVSAYYSSTSATIGTSSLPNYMYNQQVTRPNSTSSWTYSPLKYWPQAGTLQFFA